MPGDAHAQVNSEALQQACPVPFDEGRLWKGAGSGELKAQLQRHFQNITKVMDCVGCEKCKLWGKLQMLGALPTRVGTSVQQGCLLLVYWCANMQQCMLPDMPFLCGT